MVRVCLPLQTQVGLLIPSVFGKLPDSLLIDITKFLSKPPAHLPTIEQLLKIDYQKRDGCFVGLERYELTKKYGSFKNRVVRSYQNTVYKGVKVEKIKTYSHVNGIVNYRFTFYSDTGIPYCFESPARRVGERWWKKCSLTGEITFL